MRQLTASVLVPLMALSPSLGAQETPDRSGSTGPPGRSNDPVADSLVGAWIEAAGGMEAYHTFTGASFTLTTEIYDRESGRLKRTRPRYVTIARLPQEEASRIERWEGDDFIQQGFDGERTWAYMNGEPLPDSAKDAREALYVARDVYYWFNLPFKLRDPGVFLSYQGRNEAQRHVVTVEFGEGIGEHQDTWLYYFQDGRAIPVELHYVEEGKTNVNMARWEGFFTSGSYVVPERRVHFDEEGRITKILRTHDVTVNPEIDLELFGGPGELPADLAPDPVIRPAGTRPP